MLTEAFAKAGEYRVGEISAQLALGSLEDLVVKYVAEGKLINKEFLKDHGLGEQNAPFLTIINSIRRRLLQEQIGELTKVDEKTIRQLTREIFVSKDYPHDFRDRLTDVLVPAPSREAIEKYIDGRADVYGDEFIFSYLDAFNLTQRWREPLEKFNVDYVLIGKSNALSTLLSEAADWQEAYQDDVAVVFIPVKE